MLCCAVLCCTATRPVWAEPEVAHEIFKHETMLTYVKRIGKTHTHTYTGKEAKSNIWAL